jgi:hypothetical protein
MMQRRNFIALLGGAAAWPLAARAQQAGVCGASAGSSLDENDPMAKTFVSAFTKALADLGWADGRNVPRPSFSYPMARTQRFAPENAYQISTLARLATWALSPVATM